ncbi:hypothetical protein F4781DRAFT_432016 [Annulohypoxylon bovei var. microspora]|nr:hypothetical protein F4781DRAFT_432016 [Annulohypoxylon bovei var. microspora]
MAAEARLEMIEDNIMYNMRQGPTNARLYCGHFWDVHLHVLKPEPQFYARALQDARRNYVLNLEHENADMVEWLVSFLYFEKVPRGLKELLDNPETFFVTCSEVLHLAAESGIWSFQYSLYESLVSLFREQAAMLLNYHQAAGGQIPPYSSDEVLLDDDFVEDFTELATLIYTSDSHKALRSVIVDFFYHTRFIALQYNVFRRLLVNLPELSRELLFASLDRPNITMQSNDRMLVLW